MSENHTFPEDKLVLRYWNCAGRGMLMRYMAYDAGLDFVEDIVDIDEDFLGGTWESTKKFLPELAGPFKALPVVQHYGTTINETGACAQYIAEIAGYMPNLPLERAKVVMICDHIYEDILINISYALWGYRDWDRDVVGGFAGPTSGLPLKFVNLEEILAGSSSGFAVGSEITMADFAIFYIVDILAQRMLMVKSGPAAVKLLFGDKPALAKHKEMMQARPNMSQYRSSAQWSLYGHHISGKGVMGDRTHELGLGDTELEGIEILTSKLVTCLS
ncbi:glutathione S-transferase family protein [Gammaproteobacteria bacterium]|nr:glutathione S-transferase family protein [Gammaproteobacteria bacterium]MDB2445120.1 glutathione S-transferase family protein [Gammaproteobacteria bacterium]MDC3239220.1 glutathione S-transferase family protein [Gammaproteobacteria bacterium]